MKRKIYLIFHLLLIILLNNSCRYIKNNKGKKELSSLVESYVGDKIQLPVDSVFILENDSIVSFKLLNQYSDKIKVVTRINGNCHSCLFNLDKWKQEIIKKTDSNDIALFFTYM